MDFAAVLEGFGIHKLITPSLFILLHLLSEDLKVLFNLNETHLTTASDIHKGHNRNLFKLPFPTEVNPPYCSLNICGSTLAKFNRLQTSPSSPLYSSCTTYSMKAARIQEGMMQLSCNLCKIQGLVPLGDEKCHEI